MKKYLFIIALGLFCTAEGVAQTVSQILSTDVWHEGYIIGSDDQKREGRIKYNLETGVIQFDDSRGDVDALTSQNLIYFQIFDSIERKLRRFYSLPYALDGSYESLVFFEIILEGQLNLLSREKRKTITKTARYWGTYYSYGEEILEPEFFLLIKDGTIRSFSGKSREFYLIIDPKHHQEIKRFVSENRLKMKDRGDLARIVNYYNRIAEN